MQVKNLNLYIANFFLLSMTILKNIYIWVSLSDNVSITIFFAYA